MAPIRQRNFLCDQDGAISIIAALSMALLLAVAAVVIDTGSLYFARRNLQSVSDAAALAAVQNPANATAIATSVFSTNGYSNPTLTVTAGVYSPDESLSAANRFTPGNSGANAVKVRASIHKMANLAGVFGLSNLMTVTTQSTAARVPTVSFGAGTGIANLNGGVINSLLGQLWGSNLSLSLIDYQSLLNTNVNALTFFDQLATTVGVTGTYQQLASSSVSVGQLLDALIATASTSGAVNGVPTGALLALRALRLQLASGTPMLLSKIVDLAPLQGRTIGNVAEIDSTGLQLNLMSLLSASARTVAAGRLIDVGAALTVPVTNSAVTTRLAIGSQMAQVADAAVGTSIHTAQIRLALTATLVNVNLGVATANVQVPIYLEAAPGQATLTAMPCGAGGNVAQVSASSGLTSLSFGTVTNAALNNFSTPVTPATAPVVNISLLGIPIQANISGGVTVGANGPTTFSFTQADIAAGTVKSLPNSTATPFAALSANLSLSTSILGNAGLLAAALNTALSTLLNALNPLVTSLIAPLDAPVNSVMAALGLQLGVIDVKVFDATCRTPTLVG
jgi:uncharacterized membrane protein